MKRLAVVFFFLFILILLFLHPISLDSFNVDIGYHLLVGEIISKTHTVPTTNIFAYTAPNFPYVLHAWLTEVLFYYIFVFFGYNGLIVFAVVLICITFLLLLQNPEIQKKTFASFIVGMFYLSLLAGRTEVRPELLSLLLLSIYLSILYAYKRNYTPLLFILPLLQLLWVSIHIFFIVGVIIVVLFFIDLLISHRFSLHNKKVKTLGIILVCCICVNSINPQLLHGALYPFTVFSHYELTVEENVNMLSLLLASYDYTIILILFVITSLLSILVVGYKHGKVAVIDVLLFFIFSLFALFAIRNISLFVVGTFIPAVKAIDIAMQYLRKNYSSFSYHTILVICIGLLVAFFINRIMWTVSYHNIGLGVIDESKEAVDLVNKYNISGPIYNTYNLGSYLGYKLYPREKVFVNGSPEAYPTGFFTATNPILSSPNAFWKADSKYHFNLVIYDHGNVKSDRHVLVEELIKSDRWKLIYLNNKVVVFVKDIPENKKIITEHFITEKNVKLSDRDINTKEKVENLSVLFYAMGWKEKRYEMSQKYLTYEPTNCVALQNVATYLKNTSDPEYVTYAQRYNKSCWMK